MKKFISALFIVFFLAQISFAQVGNPSVVFDLTEKPQPKSSGSGLSGGAITAITLGSIGAVALLGIGGLIYKKKIAQGLNLSNVMGQPTPLKPFCLDIAPNSGTLVRVREDYPYLQKALKVFQLKECPNAQYLFVYDTELGKEKFDVIKFEIPAKTKNIKIVMATEPDTQKNIELVMYGRADFDAETNVMDFSMNDMSDIANGLLFQEYDLSLLTYPLGELVLTNENNKKIYAIVLEFNF